MNVELLEKIAEVIQERPQEFDMGDWHALRTGVYRKAGSLAEFESFAREPGCRTTHCIAGLAQVLSGSDKSGLAPEVAQAALRLSPREADRLFYAENWPSGFGAWNASAAQAAARIRRFIATEGRE